MGLFNKKKTVDLDEVFKEKYKALNGIMQSAHEELDYTIKAASMELAIEKYDQLLELIDQGANFDREHFYKLKEDAIKELDLIKGLE
mgnify:FL=1